MQDIHHHSMDGGGARGAGSFFGGGIGGGLGGGSAGGGGGGDRRMRATHHHHHHNHHQALKCPRCDSLNTKFCYYNNYNLSQPRHFCKTCRRYWTKGGVLRNVPVGGGCRKAKRAKSKQSSSAASAAEKSSLDGDEREGKSSASHSSSESSSVTASNSAAVASATATTATAVASCSASAAEAASASSSAPVSGFLSSPKLYGNGIEWSALLGQGSSDGGIFTEIGSFTSLIATSSNETTPFALGGNSVNQQCLDHNLKVEGETRGGLLDDQAAHVEFPGRSLDQNVGFGPLDWGGGGGDQALFDLTSTVDHAYWSQTQWATDQDHGGLYLP